MWDENRYSPVDAHRRILLWHWGREGAGAKFSHALVRGLRKVSGTDVAVSVAAKSDFARDMDKETGIPVQSVVTFQGDKARLSGKFSAGFALLGLPRIGAEFSGAMKEFQPDVALCAFQSIWDLAALPILRRSASRFVLVLHDAEPHPGDRYPFRKTVMDWEIKSADALIALSDHVANEAVRLHGFQRDRIYTVPHGAFTFGEPFIVPRRFPVGRPFRLLFFGRIVAYKGLGVLLDAYRQLRAEGWSVELAILGSGDMSTYRDALGGLEGVSVRNDWIGDAEIADALVDADIVVLPYIEASQSGVAASAFSAALPVIATPVGGLVEQIDHGVTGLITSEVNANALAETVARVISSPLRYEALSAGALGHAREALDWDIISERIGSIIDEVIRRPRRNGGE
jgi:glycosyltransferase involved in cell wall biosynthesis